MRALAFILVYQIIAICGLFGFYSVDGMTPTDYCFIAHVASGCTIIAHLAGNILKAHRA